MEHLRQIQRAIDYIEDHMAEDISSDLIAKVAGFSKWHFQMVFSSAVGDTLKEYIRKRRLTAALIALGATDKRIIDIALDAGFESQEAFTRAFKHMFGKNPGECRKEGIKSVIPALWEKYVPRSQEIVSRVSPTDVGVCFDPGQDKTHPDECFYIAGTEVKSMDQIPQGMMSMTIPAGRYAVFTHKGSLQKLQMTMKYIYGSWLPKSGEKLRDAPDFEVYDQRFKPDSEDSELDIYIPVQ